jgi:hypothetical protein
MAPLPSSTELDAVELHAVAGDDLVALLGRHVAEHALDVLRRVRIRARRVREVRAPHDPVDADLLAQLRRQRVVDDAGVDVFLDVAARGLFLQVVEAGEGLDPVEAVLEDRQPRRVVLRENDLEPGEAVEDAAEDELVGQHRRGFGEQLEEALRHVLALLLAVVGERVAHPAGDDVQRHRQPGLLGGGPERVVPAVAVRRRTVDRAGPDQDATGASLHRAGQLPGRPLDVDDRDHRVGEQLLAVLRAVLLDPVVVDLGAGVASGPVRHARDPQAPGRIEDLRRDVVLGHQLEAVGRVRARLGEVLEPAVDAVGGDQLVHLRRLARPADVEEQALVALEAADLLRHFVREAVAERLAPEVARLEDVRVGGDDQFFHGACVGAT